VGQFLTQLTLLVYADAGGRPITRGGRSLWRGGSPELVYERGELGSRELLTFPRGCITDLGSIPRVAWSLEPPDGLGVEPYAIHDMLYGSAGSGMVNGRRCITREKSYTRAEADEILKEALQAVGVPAVHRYAIWAAVRIGGASGWGH
jgi:hypothetical protein